MASTMWIVYFLMFSVVYWQCEAAVFNVMGNNPNKDGCIVRSKKYAVGEDWFTPGQCMRYTCTSNNGDHMGVTCPDVRPVADCGISLEDNTKRFPRCCPRVICGGYGF